MVPLYVKCRDDRGRGDVVARRQLSERNTHRLVLPYIVVMPMRLRRGIPIGGVLPTLRFLPIHDRRHTAVVERQTGQRAFHDGCAE